MANIEGRIVDLIRDRVRSDDDGPSAFHLSGSADEPDADLVDLASRAYQEAGRSAVVSLLSSDYVDYRIRFTDFATAEKWLVAAWQRFLWQGSHAESWWYLWKSWLDLVELRLRQGLGKVR